MPPKKGGSSAPALHEQKPRTLPSPRTITGTCAVYPPNHSCLSHRILLRQLMGVQHNTTVTRTSTTTRCHSLQVQVQARPLALEQPLPQTPAMALLLRLVMILCPIQHAHHTILPMTRMPWVHCQLRQHVLQP